MSDTKNSIPAENQGDTKSLLDSAKLLLEITATENDEVLKFLIDDTIAAVLAYCRLEVLPRQLEGFVASISARRLTHISGGDIKSVTEGDRRVEYRDEEYDFLSEYAERLKPFMSRAAYVPSEMDGDAND